VGGSHSRACRMASVFQAASQHGLEVLAYPSNDVAGNCTRFLLLQRAPAIPCGPHAQSHPTAAFRLLAATNNPGPCSMPCAASPFGRLNMSRIESRPSKREMRRNNLVLRDLELPARFGLPWQAVPRNVGRHCEIWSCRNLPNQLVERKRPASVVCLRQRNTELHQSRCGKPSPSQAAVGVSRSPSSTAIRPQAQHRPGAAEPSLIESIRRQGGLGPSACVRWLHWPKGCRPGLCRREDAGESGGPWSSS